MKETFKNLKQLIQHFSDEQVCRDYLAEKRWGGKPVCVYCGHDKVYSIENGKRYKCANSKCYKKFSVTVGTIYEDSNLPLSTWYQAVYLITSHKKGISSYQLGKLLGVTQKTAWFMWQRVREMLKDKAPTVLGGVVAVDETFVGGKNKNRHWDKKCKYYAGMGRDQADKVPVFGMIQQDGRVIAMVVRNTKKETLIPIIKDNVEKGTTIVSDDYSTYTDLREDYIHKSVKHLPPKGERLKGERYFQVDGYNTQSIENFWSIFKRGIFGIYHHVTPKHLQRYCDEFTARRNTKDMKEDERFDLFMGQCEGSLPYKRLKQNAVYYPYFDKPTYE